MITLRALTPQDHNLFPEALELLNRTQGRNLFKPDYMEKRTQDSQSYVVGAFQNRALIGVGVAQVLPKDGFSYYLPFDHRIPELFQKNKMGSFSTLCLREDLQGQGIGQKLSVKRLDWLRAQGCQTVVGVSWISGLAHTSNRVFEKMGFRCVGKVDRFYEQTSLQDPFICPGCGEPPCSCGALLYRFDF